MKTIRWGIIGCGDVTELDDIGVCPSIGLSAARTSRVMDEILKDYNISRS
jgi:hypothetical protein